MAQDREKHYDFMNAALQLRFGILVRKTIILSESYRGFLDFLGRDARM